MHTVSKHTPSLHVNKTAHAHDKTGIGTCQNKSLTVTSNASNTRCFLASKFSNRYGAKNAPEGRILYLNIRIISGGQNSPLPQIFSTIVCCAHAHDKTAHDKEVEW